MKIFKLLIITFFSIFLTFFFSYYQRKTGPTYPVKIKLKLFEKEFIFKLPRSWDTDKNLKIFLPFKEKSIKADIFYKVYKKKEDWKTIEFKKGEKGLYVELEPLPAAGKYEYYLKIFYLSRALEIPDKPITCRFKNPVPLPLLVLHIIIVFLGFFFSIFTGIYNFFYPCKKNLVLITFILFLAGAGFLGPIVQYYAFGQFWSGFPFGKDLTDNKGLILIIFWGVTYYKTIKGRAKNWILISFLITIITFFIPHSLWGSELRNGKIVTGP